MAAPALHRKGPTANDDHVSWMAGTQLLGRAMGVLMYLRDREEPITVGELATALSLPSNTVYRIVRTLEMGGLVDRSDRPYVSLGLRLMDLGQAKQRLLSRALAPFATPILQRLTADTEETSLLIMPTGARAICIFAVEPSRAIRLSYQPGRVFPLYAGASGKILLPWLSTTLVETAIAQGDGQVLQDGSKLTAAGLRRDIVAMKASGYCVSHGEVDAGASAVAAPVFGRGRQIFAAVSVAGPETGFSSDRLPFLIKRVVAAAAEISRQVAARA